MAKLEKLLFPSRTVPEFVEEVKRLTEEIKRLYCEDQIPFVIGLSGGKDSTAIVQLIWNAIAEIPVEQRNKKVYVITTDTLVENPIVSAWVNNSLKKMEQTAKEQQLPIEPHLLKPEITQSYWVALIGKGYPAPRQKFRWCTPRLKIDPSNRFIRNVVRSNGEAIVVLGTRKSESVNRARILKEREEGRLRERLCAHPQLPSSFLYTPIEDWKTDEVWLYLMQWENPWGQSNQDLLALYRGATEDNECPLVVDTSTPSCGSSRFGCWVCTLVDTDKSLKAMIRNDEEKEWLQPLVDFRRELDIKNDREKRDFRRIYGKVELFEKNNNGQKSIEPIPGPYTKYWREHWLRRILEAQVKLRETAPDGMKEINLIQPEELREIRRIWLEEKHEFEDSLPRIYEEATGEKYYDPEFNTEDQLLGADEWLTLEELCGDDPMYFELMMRLLDTERQFFTKSRRSGIIGALEKCFDISSRSKEEAIRNAHYRRHLKEAVKELDFKTLQYLLDNPNIPQDEMPKKEETQQAQSWGALKFPES